MLSTPTFIKFTLHIKQRNFLSKKGEYRYIIDRERTEKRHIKKTKLKKDTNRRKLRIFEKKKKRKK